MALLLKQYLNLLYQSKSYIAYISICGNNKNDFFIFQMKKKNIKKLLGVFWARLNHVAYVTDYEGGMSSFLQILLLHTNLTSWY